MERPNVRYARSGDVNIAYQVVGDGAFDLVLVPGFISHLDLDWDEPRSAHFLYRLASFSRLIRFDKRGTGLSDRPRGLPDLETRMDDVRAVLDAVGSQRAVLFGYSEGGPLSVLFAGTFPERTSGLVLYGTYAKRRDPDDDYPWASTWERRQGYASETERTWDSDADMSTMAPNADAAMTRWWVQRARAAASPGAARDLILMNSQVDIRPLLPSIRVPTLVVHRRGDLDSKVEEGRYIAAHIPHARFVELPGEDHLPWVDPDQILDVVEEFLTGVPRAPEPDRVLATILFTDIVGSTERAGALGDRQWRAMLDGHDRIARQEIDRFQGRLVKSTGDGVLAIFDGPGRALRCASALRNDVRSLGIEIRSGLHCGEVELREDDVGGIAVHIGARIASMAEPGQVLVSSTVKDLVTGSGMSFNDLGEHQLKGVLGMWKLFSLNLPET
jgi:class 3 adenylate cyclase